MLIFCSNFFISIIIIIGEVEIFIIIIDSGVSDIEGKCIVIILVMINICCVILYMLGSNYVMDGRIGDIQCICRICGVVIVQIICRNNIIYSIVVKGLIEIGSCRIVINIIIVSYIIGVSIDFSVLGSCVVMIFKSVISSSICLRSDCQSVS